MKKMLLFHKLSEEHVRQIQQIAPDWQVIHWHDHEEDWIEHAKQADIWLGFRNEAKNLLLSGSAKPRWIQLWNAGVDRLPLSTLHQYGTLVTNASGVHAYPISETVFGMMLSWARSIHTSIAYQLKGEWNKKDTMPIGEIHGKTIGIVGVGAIGKEIAVLAKAFRMTVLGLRRSSDPCEYVDRMYSYDQLDDMLPHCDFVVNTLPLTERTKHLFTEKQFALMKNSAFFVNIGRGATVHTDHLVAALQNGVIAGAGLDVFDPEPLPEGHPLWKLENVIITPHTSGATPEYTNRMMDIFLPNLQAYVQGQQLPINVVDTLEGY